MKVVYELSVEGTYSPRNVWTPVEATGRCKVKAKGPYIGSSEPKRYMEIRRKKFFGLKSYTVWVSESRLKVCEPTEEVISWCTCLTESKLKRKTK
jgi:hypothetical protein